ncbi:10977_t:CDS:2 [Ambispora leptoticha]|uniref:10977_t:CDS:1 n=1 Tax=Ambispora leptoticha TaxID=144679 RepID=A0A9N9AI46_9GLOM|nr:10977_t:CDS:2 [Ambispora leptoticha]
MIRISTLAKSLNFITTISSKILKKTFSSGRRIPSPAAATGVINTNRFSLSFTSNTAKKSRLLPISNNLFSSSSPISLFNNDLISSSFLLNPNYNFGVTQIRSVTWHPPKRPRKKAALVRRLNVNDYEEIVLKGENDLINSHVGNKKEDAAPRFTNHPMPPHIISIFKKYFKTQDYQPVVLQFPIHGAKPSKKETEPANPPGEDVELSAELIDNPFSLVVNGQQTKLRVTFNNKGQENYTVRFVAGALTNPENATEIFTRFPAVQYDYPVPTMDHAELEYRFYSEFSPQDLDLVIFVIFTNDEKRTRFEGIAYNSTIHIVEPEQSIFDLQLLFLYLILAGIIGGVGYLIFQAFFGGLKSKKNQKLREQKIAEKQAAQASIELTTYDENWIPAHHLKKPKNKKKEDKAD